MEVAKYYFNEEYSEYLVSNSINYYLGAAWSRILSF